jgi:3,2-trans-enoyl-CoA isomerase
MLEMVDHGRILEVRISRPPANALDPELISLLARKLADAGDAADAVVVSGRPGMFSAGLDIPALLQLDRAGIARFWLDYLELLHTIAGLPIPTAFALTGHAPAGGIVLSLYADYRIMAAGNYKTGLNEVQVGLVVSPVIKDALARLIGAHPAEKILVPGAMLNPEQALAIGLVDELAADPELTVPRALEWCRQMLSLPRAAMLETRRLAREDLRHCFAEPARYRVEAFVEQWFSDTTQSILRELVARLQKK